MGISTEYTCMLLFSCKVVSISLSLSPASLLCPCDYPGKNTGMGCHLLLQGIFPTQGSVSLLLLWQMDSLPLSHQESLIYVCRLAIYFNQRSPMKCNTDEETEAQGIEKLALLAGLADLCDKLLQKRSISTQ